MVGLLERSLVSVFLFLIHRKRRTMSNYKRKRPKSQSRACNCGGKFFKKDGNSKVYEDVKKDTPQEHLPVAGKKNTRKWCKGKVGRKHVKHWQPTKRYLRANVMEEVCSVCSKTFRICFPPFRYYSDSKYECICGCHTRS